MNELIYSFFDYKPESFIANISFCIALSVIVISVFGSVMNRRFSSGWRYALWLVLPFCFLIPFKIKFPFSVIPLYEFLYLPLRIKSPPLIFTDGIGDAGGYTKEAYDAPEVLALGDVLIWVCLAVFIVSLVYQLIKLLALDRRIKRFGIPCGNTAYKNTLEKICGEMKIKVPEMIVFPETDTPFAMGFFRPKIILPSQNFTDEEIGFILRHEAVHIKRKDTFIKLFMIVFRAANWYNPFVYVMCRRAFEDMEITCDEKATAGFSEEQRARYSETILKGISKGKYPAVTTYLSSNAKMLKKRISAVMTVKKFGGLIPFTVVFIAVLFGSSTVYAVPNNIDSYAPYTYMNPHKIEADPYNVGTEWRTCEAANAEEAGRKIFTQYMDMYTGEDVPEYYRISKYCINDVHPSGENKLMSWIGPFPYGLLDNKVYCYIYYSAEYFNKCGNTAHHQNMANNVYFNGYTVRNIVAYEMEKRGNSYTLTNIGTYNGSFMGNVHFRNDQTENLEKLDLMTACGMFDRSWNVTDNPPDAEALLMSEYYSFKEYNPDHDLNISSYWDGCFFSMRIRLEDTEYLKEAACVDKETGVVTDKNFSRQEKKFEYCGCDWDCENLKLTAYGNILCDKPYGVVLEYVSNDPDTIMPSLISATVTDKLFTPVVYHDSFADIRLPDGLTSAEEILEYMKTPRDGCDFTVLDYRNITEENGAVYAEVKFKGRLDGVYASDLKKTDRVTKEPVSDGYIRVRVI